MQKDVAQLRRKYLCPVCGFGMEDPPRGNNICPSCGTEFGYHDAGRTFQDLRLRWLLSGAQWWSAYDKKPEGWDPLEQLKSLEPVAASAWTSTSVFGEIEGDFSLNWNIGVKVSCPS